MQSVYAVRIYGCDSLCIACLFASELIVVRRVSCLPYSGQVVFCVASKIPLQIFVIIFDFFEERLVYSSELNQLTSMQYFTRIKKRVLVRPQSS